MKLSDDLNAAQLRHMVQKLAVTTEALLVEGGLPQSVAFLSVALTVANAEREARGLPPVDRAGPSRAALRVVS